MNRVIAEIDSLAVQVQGTEARLSGERNGLPVSVAYDFGNEISCAVWMSIVFGFLSELYEHTMGNVWSRSIQICGHPINIEEHPKYPNCYRMDGIDDPLLQEEFVYECTKSILDGESGRLILKMRKDKDERKFVIDGNKIEVKSNRNIMFVNFNGNTIYFKLRECEEDPYIESDVFSFIAGLNVLQSGGSLLIESEPGSGSVRYINRYTIDSEVRSCQNDIRIKNEGEDVWAIAKFLGLKSLPVSVPSP